MIGDVVGKNGCEFLKWKLPLLKESKKIDFIIVNGENSAEGNGIIPVTADYIFNSGANVITTGNHVFRRKEIRKYLDDNQFIIRPLNYPPFTTPGNGYCKIDLGNVRVCIINVLGTIFLESMRCPLTSIDEIMDDIKDCEIKIVDFHAEATAEKRAMGFYLDGRVSAVLGTHTHVQTSDECILPKGTGYMTDVGMTGVIHSVLGVKPEISISRIKDKLPIKFENANGACKMECVLLDIDNNSGKTKFIERLRITPDYKG